jgi:phosphatidylglycerol:prolipoprotein diacylglycerol transferase
MNLAPALAVIPWFTLGPWKLGPVTVQGFGLMVAIGVVLAYQVCTWRAPKMSLSVDKMQSLVLYMLVSGFIGSHFLDLLLYEPEKVWANPKILFNFGATLSSYGGVFGAMVGMALWKWRNPLDNFLAYGDVASFALPTGWFFGRVGCAVVHDHPGTLSSNPLALEIPRAVLEKRPDIAKLVAQPWPESVAIHDLGIYEAMWWVVILAIFWGAMGSTWELTRRHPGFHIYLLPLVYAPARFGLDFLRIADARYLGLTPAQWISLGFFAWGAAMMWRWNQRRLAAG